VTILAALAPPLLLFAVAASTGRPDPARSRVEPGGLPRAAGAYTFLGDLTGFDRTERGAVFLCRPGARLEVTFLGPGTVRITLGRPDRDATLLETPLATLPVEPMDLDIVEDPDRIVLRLAVPDHLPRPSRERPEPGRPGTRDRLGR
jgi:hypothetical protein